MKNFEPRLPEPFKKATFEEMKKSQQGRYFEVKKSIISAAKTHGDQVTTHCSLVDDSFCDHIYELTHVIKESSRSASEDGDDELSDEPGPSDGKLRFANL